MKIAINGDIIDTKDIYKITKTRWYYSNGDQIIIEFEVRSLNGNVLKVTKYFNIYHCKNGINCLARGEVLERLAVIIKARLDRFRDAIIKSWSEDQSDIPQFNI